MHGPISAKEIIPCRGTAPGVCQLNSPNRTMHGFFVPYRRLGRIAPGLEQWEAVIELFVQDLSSHSTFVDFLPFVIDTATDITIIPRKLLPPGVFPISRTVRPHEVPVTGLTGRTVFGHTFFANLAIVPPRDFVGISLGKLKIVAVDHWDGNYAMLGLDAIRRAVMVSDQRHITFWLPSAHV